MSDMKVRLRLQAKDDGLKATVKDAAQSVDELSQSSEKLDKETKQATDSQDKFGDSAKKSGKKVKDASDSNAQASKSTADFSSKLKGGAVTAGVWAAATVAAGVAAAGMVAIVRTDAIREINNLSDTLNVSTASLTEWQYAAGQMGLESDKVGDIFKDVSDKVGDFVTTGGGEAADIFENLNVQVKDLQSLSPDEQFLKIADALDDVNRNQQIFFLESIADDASRLLPLLDNGAQRLIAMRREAQVLGVSISDIDADIVSQAAGEMSRLKALGEGTANSLAIEFAPILSAVSGGIVDWVVQAGGFRNAIGWAVDGSVSAIGFLLDYGRMVEIWLTGITSYALQFATYATEGMDAYADAISSVINTALYPFQQAYSYVFDGLATAMRRVSGLVGPFSDEFEAAADMLDAASIKVRDFRVEAEDVAQVNDAIAASYQTVSDRLAELLESEDPSVLLKENLADLRAEMEETAKANQALQASQTSDTASKATIDANQKIIDSLREELQLLGMTERERAIARQTNQLDINDKIALTETVKAQIVEVEVLAGKIYDLGEAQKAAAKEQEDFKKQLDDANTAAQRFLQDGNLGEIEGLESIQEQLRDAMSVKGITSDMEADFSEAIDKIQSRIGELKFNNMVDGLSSGISALQGLTEQGTDSYQKMQIALTAFNVVQGVAAVLHQLKDGDPYTAFARAGATLAAVAQLGVAINGGGGLDVSAQRQASQGTGTVLGDASAKSESILKSNELIAEAVEEIVGINRSMLDALLNLEVSINGAALQITRRWDDTVLAPQAVELGGISSVSGLFSSISESLNILDLGGLIADIAGASVKGKDSGLVLEAPNLTNISAQSYATWEERKNWLDDYDTKWQFTDLDPQITQQLRLVIGGISDSVRAGAEQLNMSGDAIDQAIQSFALERTLISLKGLTADEQQEELQAVFSAMFDDMSMHVMPWLVEFQQAGEGLGETLSRLATEASAVDNVVGMLGLTFGTVDDQLRAKTNLVSAMGGLEEFVSAYSSFSDKFLSEEQQFANARDQLQSAFAQYDAILPASREDYLALVQAQDAATDAGAKNIAKLFELSTAADEYYSMLEDREDERQQEEERRLSAIQQAEEQRLNVIEQTNQSVNNLVERWSSQEDVLADANLRIEEFNRSLSRSGDQFIDAKQELLDYIDSQDSASESGRILIANALGLADAIEQLDASAMRATQSLDSARVALIGALNTELSDLESEQQALENQLLTAKQDYSQVLLKDISDLQRMYDGLSETLETARSNLINSYRHELDLANQAYDQLEQNLLNAKEALQQAREDRISALNNEIQQQKNVQNEAEKMASTWLSLSDQLANTRRTLQKDDALRVGNVQTQYYSGVLSDALTGNQSAISDLPRAATDYVYELKQGAASGAEYREQMAILESQILSVEALTLDRKTTQEKIADAAELQAKQLASTVSALEDQVELTNGIQRTLLTLNAANDAYITAQTELSEFQHLDSIEYYQTEIERLEAGNKSLISIDEAQLAYNKASLALVDSHHKEQIEALEDERDALEGIDDSVVSLDNARSQYERANLSLVASNHATQMDMLRNQLNYLQQINSGQTTLAEALAAYSSLGGGALPKFANGGIASGPVSGYPVELHGVEAVVPLRNGAIPVNISSTKSNDVLLTQVLNELASLRKDHNNAGHEQKKAIDKLNAMTSKWDQLGLKVKSA
ncbi:hypothetical protein [Marinomonas fungiae]|uniref:Uncharacterized protein n=1 Tax=Marinomonas fungiae TaxID=1137284 RepID=A0A0K6IJ93_9GAMM|nr:hypothetical protein [Marinomonas fungiae]CUB03164.1 hypothetical protein Ga0061065_10312 [Marinomonas fungiae]